jgi:vacuolar-type H+-ATPase subunit I/STV1
MVSKGSCLVLAALLLTTHVSADNLYRYKNDVGGTVVDWHVPAEFAGRGYEVLSLQGEVPELKNKDLVKRLQQDAAVERARLAEWDRFLLLRYSTVEDIDAAQERSLRELKIRLSVLFSNRRSARTRLEKVLARVADLERRGEAAQQQDLDTIAGLRAEIESRSRAIADRETQVVAVTKEFNDDRDRFAQLQDVVLLRRSLSRD